MVWIFCRFLPFFDLFMTCLEIHLTHLITGSNKKNGLKKRQKTAYSFFEKSAKSANKREISSE